MRRVATSTPRSMLVMVSMKVHALRKNIGLSCYDFMMLRVGEGELTPDHADIDPPTGWDDDEMLPYSMGSIMVLPGCTAYLYHGPHYNGERFTLPL